MTAGWQTDRRPQFICNCPWKVFLYYIHMPSSLCGCCSVSFGFLSWSSFFYSLYGFISIYLSQFVLFSSYLVLFSVLKNESTSTFFTTQGSGETHTHTHKHRLFVVSISYRQKILFLVHRWETPNKFHGIECSISPLMLVRWGLEKFINSGS